MSTPLSWQEGNPMTAQTSIGLYSILSEPNNLNPQDPTLSVSFQPNVIAITIAANTMDACIAAAEADAGTRTS
jgi:hypothetical protein